MRKVLLPLLMLSMLLLTGCPSDPTLPPSTSGGGFIFGTTWLYNGISGTAPFTTLSWTWQQDSPGAAGDASSFYGETGDSALGYSLNGRVGARWGVVWADSSSYSACDGSTTSATVLHAGDEVSIVCIETGASSGGIGPDAEFGFNPNPINTASPPSSVSVQGAGFSVANGMPVIQYFDLNGNLVSQASATSVSTDGTTLVFSTPNFTELSAGTYAGILSNLDSGGNLQYVGTTSVSIPEPFYRPTSYSDNGTSDPNDWTQTVTPNGPIVGGFLGTYTTTVTAYNDWENDQNGGISETSEAPGQCTWSGFPSHVDPNNLTLYIPYSTSVGNSTSPSNSGQYQMQVTIGGTSQYLGVASNGSGVLTVTIPAGTNISTVQVAASVSPENYTPNGNTGYITDYLAMDVYIQ